MSEDAPLILDYAPRRARRSFDWLRLGRATRDGLLLVVISSLSFFAAYSCGSSIPRRWEASTQILFTNQDSFFFGPSTLMDYKSATAKLVADASIPARLADAKTAAAANCNLSVSGDAVIQPSGNTGVSLAYIAGSKEAAEQVLSELVKRVDRSAANVFKIQFLPPEPIRTRVISTYGVMAGIIGSLAGFAFIFSLVRHNDRRRLQAHDELQAATS